MLDSTARQPPSGLRADYYRVVVNPLPAQTAVPAPWPWRLGPGASPPRPCRDVWIVASHGIPPRLTPSSVHRFHPPAASRASGAIPNLVAPAPRRRASPTSHRHTPHLATTASGTPHCRPHPNTNTCNSTLHLEPVCRYPVRPEHQVSTRDAGRCRFHLSQVLQSIQPSQPLASPPRHECMPNICRVQTSRTPSTSTSQSRRPT